MHGFDNMVVFDIETTGTSPIEHKITEIGAIKIQEGKIVATYNKLVNPEVPIPYYITNMTGITNEMVSNKPVIEEVLPEFLSFCDSEFILGHNIMFDYRFMKANAVRNGLKFEKKAYDTLIIARELLKFLPSRKLGALCQYYNIKQYAAHRASDDARVTYELFLKLKEEYFNINSNVFKPKKMTWKPKKQSGITIKQKKFLCELVQKYNIEVEKDIDELSKSEASRYIDNILHKYGRKWG